MADELGIDLELKKGVRLQVNTEGSIGTRGVTVNFSDCVASPCSPPFTERIVGNRTTEGGNAVSLTVKDVGKVGVGPTLSRDETWIIGRVIDPADGETEVWFIDFRDFSAAPDHICHGSGSGPLVVSHPDRDTWVVEASATNLACLRSEAAKPGGDGSEELHGTSRLPFRLTLTRKP